MILGVIFKACTLAADKVGNAVLLNHSTYGVSCETSWNIHTIMNYIEGNSNNISSPDTNHNVKNCHYQLVGVSCSDVIGL